MNVTVSSAVVCGEINWWIQFRMREYRCGGSGSQWRREPVDAAPSYAGSCVSGH